MPDRRSAIVLLFRFFVTVFVITFLVSMFWNTLSGTNMFPFGAGLGFAGRLNTVLGHAHFVLFNHESWHGHSCSQMDSMN